MDLNTFLHLYPNLISAIPLIGLIFLLGLLIIKWQIKLIVLRTINAEEGLRETNKRLINSEARYVLAVQGSRAGLWDWEVGTDNVFYSPYLKNILGYGDNEFADKFQSLKDALHPEERAEVLELIDQHLQTKIPFNMNLRLRRKIGDYHWFHAVGQALWNEEGKATRMAGSMSDITEQKNNEQRLKAQYTISQILSEVSTIEDATKRVIQTICEILEWDVGSIWMVDNEKDVIRISSNWHHPDFKTVQVYIDVSRSKEFTRGVGIPGIVWNSGTSLWLEDLTRDARIVRARAFNEAGLTSAFSSPICLQNKVIGIVEFFSRRKRTPETELLNLMMTIGASLGQFIQRKVIENELRDSEAYKTAILESASDCIITVDKDGIIISSNRKIKEMFGYTINELKEKKINIIIPALLKLDSYEQEQAIELEGLAKNKVHFPVEIIASMMTKDKEHKYVCIIRDITERKKIEKLKNEFVSVVSHELRTPLTSIRGSLGLILGGTVGKFPEKAEKLLNIANNNCERLLLLINDILDIEKIEAGKMNFTLKKVDLTALIEEAIAVNKIYADKYQVGLVLTDAPKEIFVNVDPDRLMQVITNLISNAAKFSLAGQDVKITIGVYHSKVRLSVINSGPGIPKEFQSRIFQKFSQADSSDTRGKGGTGLGLSISKAIIEKLGGTLNFVSHPNIETTFYFDLPVWREAPVIDINQENSKKKRGRLLICEDDLAQAKFLVILMESAGFKADIAYTVKDAKKLLSTNSYQALLLDLVLPDQDGVAFIRELRDKESTANLPIIVLSVLAQTGKELLKGDAFSLIDWLDKPVDLSKLLKAITYFKKQSGKTAPLILHIEDDEDNREVIASIINENANIISAASLQDATNKLHEHDFDLIILDLILPDGHGSELLPLLSKYGVPIIVFSATELAEEHNKFVTQALIKSETTNEELLKTIKHLL